MRIESGVTTRYIYFVAVDATDFASRETGLASFTVYRSRNGGAAAAFTTPTINETDATNMPGVYELLLDEDTTIAAGNDSEEMVLHITHAGMAPVTRTIELYRPKITAGNTLGVAADGDISGNVDGSVASVTGAVGSVTGSVGSISGVAFPTNFSDLAITATTGLVDVNDKSGYSISGTLTTLDALDTAQDTQHSTTQTAISNLNDPTAAAIADAVWLETLADHSGTAGSTAEALNAAGAAGDPWTTALPGAYGAGSAGNIIGNLNDLSAAEVNAQVDTALADYDAPTKAELDAGLAALNDPTAAAIADAVLDESLAGHVTAGTLGKAIADIETDATAILEDTGTTLPASIAALNDLDAAAVRTAIGMAAANLDTQLSSLSTQASVDVIDGIVDAILVDTDTTIPALIAALNDLAASDILTTQLTESYAADGTAPTLSQAIFLIQQFLFERSVTGTTTTIKKLDGSTTAATLTLDNGTSPTSITRAS